MSAAGEELRFVVDAGILIRGKVRRAILNAAFERGFKASVEQDGRSLRFTVLPNGRTGLTQFHSDIASWVRQFEVTDT